MDEPRGPYTVVPYDASGRLLPPLSVEHHADGVAGAWEAARLALPRGAAAFAFYDSAGALVRFGLAPVETLSDDPDVSTVAMDATGERVVTGHTDGDVRLWNLATRDPVWTRAPADEAIAGVAFLDRGPWVLAWCDDGPLLLLERDSGEVITRIEDPQVGPFVVVAAPDESEIACTGPIVRRIALPGGEPLPALDADSVEVSDEPAEDGGVGWVAYLPGDATILGVRGTESAELVFWSRATGAREASVPLPHPVAACDLSPDGALAALASAEEPTRLSLVDTRLRAVTRTLELGGRGVLDLRFSADGRTLVVHDEGTGVIVLDGATGERRAVVPEDDGVGLLVPRDGAVLGEEFESTPIMVTHDSAGRLELTQLVPPAPLGPTGRSVARDGRRYATVPYATDNNWAAVYDLDRRVGIATLPHGGNVQEIWLSPDGTRVAVRAAGHVTVWRVPEAPLRRL